MIGALKQKSHWQQPLLILLTLVTKLVFVFFPDRLSGYTDPGGLLVPFLNRNVVPNIGVAALNFLSIVLLLISALYAGNRMFEAKMFSREHSLVALSIILITGLFPASNLALPVWLLMPLLIFVFAESIRMYKSEKSGQSILNMGLGMGTLYVLYHPFIFVVPIIFIALFIMRPFRARELILMLLSLLAPLYFVMAYEYVFGYFDPLQHAPNFSLFILPWLQGYFWYSSIAVAAFWLFAAFTTLQKELGRTVIRGRKSWQVMLILPFFMAPMITVPSGNHMAAIALLSLPAGTLAANAFIGQPTTLRHQVLFWTIIVAIALAAFAWQTGQM